MERSGALIVDTGVLYAAIDRRDKHHAWVVTTLRTIKAKLVTCDPVVTETCFLLEDYPGGVRQLAAWFDSGEVYLAHHGRQMISRAFELMATYANVPMSYADACLVCLVEANPGARVFTLDSDFRIFRQRNRRVIPLIAPFA